MLAQFWTSFVIWVYHKSSMTVWGNGTSLIFGHNFVTIGGMTTKQTPLYCSRKSEQVLLFECITNRRWPRGNGTSFYFRIFLINIFDKYFSNNESDSARSGHSKNVSLVYIALILKKLFITSSISELWWPNKDHCNASSILNNFCYLSVS